MCSLRCLNNRQLGKYELDQLPVKKVRRILQTVTNVSPEKGSTPSSLLSEKEFTLDYVEEEPLNLTVSMSRTPENTVENGELYLPSSLGDLPSNIIQMAPYQPSRVHVPSDENAEVAYHQSDQITRVGANTTGSDSVIQL
jgi:hypothetical protein